MKKSGLAADTIKIICTIAIIAMVLVSICVYRASVVGLLIFFLFILFYVQLPGLLILSAAKVRMPHISGTILISFFTGWALVVSEYFITDLIGTKILLYAIGPVCSLIYLILMINGRAYQARNARLRLSRVPAAYYIAFAILMAYVFLNTQYLYMAPEYCDSIYASIDKVYQMGLITSLSHGYPLVDPWVHGRYVSYHIFTQVLLSLPVSLFGLTPDFMIMSCSPYLTVFLVSLSLYSLFRQFCQREDRAGLYTLSVIASNMFIARTATASYLFRILFTNDNYGGFGLAGIAVCTLFLGYCFKDKETQGKASISKLMLLTMLVMLLTGIKAPVGMVFAGSVIGTFLVGVILRRIRFSSAVPATVMSALGFFSVYEFLLSNDETASMSNSSVISFGHMTGICFWKSGLIDFLKGMGIPSSARLLVILIVFTVFFFTAYTLPFIIGYIRELALVVGSRKEYDFAWVSVYAGALIGFVLMMFLNYSGHSQIYFGTVLAAFAPMIAFRFLEDGGQMKSKVIKVLRAICVIWFFAVLAVTSITLALDIKGMVPEAMTHSDPSVQYRKYASLTKDEYEATKWLKENTSEDALISTQMYSSVELSEYDVTQRWHNCHFLYASYSDRKFYLEGSGFSLADSEAEKRLEMKKNTDMLYDIDNLDRGNLARSLGIDYVMVTKKIYPTPDLTSDDYTLVFSNNDIDIYQVAQ